MDAKEVKYLMGCSKPAVQSYRMSRLNRAAEARKRLREVLLDAIRAEAEAMFSGMIDEFGEQLICEVKEEKASS